MNVTPLVDVVLVLLIIFMVVAPQLAQEVQVDLPSIFNADPDVASGEPLKITIRSSGEYYFGQARYDLDGLIALVEAEHAAAPTRRLALRVDAAVPYASVREVQRRLQEVGFPGMSYAVNERHREDGEPGEEPSWQ